MYQRELSLIVKELKTELNLTTSQARKVALSLSFMEDNDIEKLFTNIRKWRENVVQCPVCNALIKANEECPYMSKKRNPEKLCIVSSQQALINIDDTDEYKGLYFIVGAEVSREGLQKSVGIDKLKKMLEAYPIKEIIFATSPTFAGELTASYIQDQLNEKYNYTRLGYGIPYGANLNFTNLNTLKYALKNRKERVDNDNEE